MNDGWIKLHRKMTNWEWFKEPNTLSLFLYFLLSANHEDGKWRGVEIKRGQLITGIPKIVENTGLSPRSVRTSINRLISTGEVTNKSTNRFRIITLVNYDYYQTEHNKPTGRTTDKLTDKRQANDRQTTSNKNDKNDKNDKNIKTNTSTEQSSESSGMVINLFKEINPSYQILFKRKNQHDSARRLLEREGFQRIKGAVDFIQARITDRFCPSISSPAQLEEKWAMLGKYAATLQRSEFNKPNWKIWT